MSVNICVLEGRMTAEPELKQTQSGTHVCSFRIAVDRRFRDADGKTATDFLNVVAWKQTAEFVSKYFHKGEGITITGSVQNRSYTDKDGNNRTVTEIIADSASFPVAKKEQNTGSPNIEYAPPPAAQNPAVPSEAIQTVLQPQMGMPKTVEPQFVDITGDDLPF